MSHNLIFENTLVGLFDIQAYSSFIENTPKELVIEKSQSLYNMAKSLAATDMGTAKTQFWILSDTIILTVDTKRSPLTFGSVNIFLNVCSYLLSNSLRMHGLPLRGAIGAGYLYQDENSGKDRFGDSSFILGDGLVDAAKFEKQQDWLGAMITPNATKLLQNILDPKENVPILNCQQMNRVCEYGQVYLKNDKTIDAHYLLPFVLDNSQTDWKTNLPAFFDQARTIIKHTDDLYLRAARN